MESDVIKVMVVDDEIRLCLAWERLVHARPDMSIAPPLHRADDLVEAVLEHQPDVVLLDLTMPGDDPIDAMERAQEARPETRFLVYSGRHDEEILQRAMDAGAWGVVDKLEDPQTILGAIRRVAQGEFVFRPA